MALSQAARNAGRKRGRGEDEVRGAGLYTLCMRMSMMPVRSLCMVALRGKMNYRQFSFSMECLIQEAVQQNVQEQLASNP